MEKHADADVARVRELDDQERVAALKWDRIDSRRAPRGDLAGERGDSRDYCGGTLEGDRVQRHDAEELAPNGVCRALRALSALH